MLKWLLRSLAAEECLTRKCWPMDELSLLCSNITCIAQVTFKFVNKILLVDKRWLSFWHIKIAFNLLADKHWRHGRVNFVTQVLKLTSNNVSWGLVFKNGKITRTASDESETAAGDETGWSENFVAMKREMVEWMSLSEYFSRKKGNLRRSHSSEKYDQLDESRKARSSIVFGNARLYRAFAWLL